MYRLLVLVLALGLAWYLVFRGDEMRSDLVVPVTIGRLLNQPGDFDGKDVSVTGIVAQGAGVMGYGGFLLRRPNSLEEILVLTGRGIPNAGVKIVVVGRFHQAFTLNNRQYSAIVQTR